MFPARLLPLLLSLIVFLPTVALAWSDYSQHKVNTVFARKPVSDQCLTVSKTVRNADGSILTEAQLNQLFEFSVEFSNGGTYSYYIINTSFPIDDTSSEGQEPDPASPSVSMDGDSDESGSPPLDILQGEDTSTDEYAEEDENTDDQTDEAENQDESVEEDEVSDESHESFAGFFEDFHFTDYSAFGMNPLIDGFLHIMYTSGPALVPTPADSTEKDNLPGDFHMPGQEGDIRSSEEMAGVSENLLYVSGDPFYLSHGQMAVFTHIQAGVGYVVKETPSEGYAVMSYGASGIIGEMRGDSYFNTVLFVNVFGGTDEKVLIEGTKTWQHGDNAPSNYPHSITVIVRADGVMSERFTISEAEDWRWSFEVPKYNEDGKEITYTIDEVDVSNYTATVNGYHLTNTYNPSVIPSPTPPPITRPTRPIARPPWVPAPTQPDEERIPDQGWVNITPEGPVDEITFDEETPLGLPQLEEAVSDSDDALQGESGMIEFIDGETPKGSPQTEDTSQPFLWILLMVASLLALACVWLPSKMKRRG